MIPGKRVTSTHPTQNAVEVGVHFSASAMAKRRY